MSRKMINLSSKSDFLIYFDDNRVDEFVTNFQVSLSIKGGSTAAINMVYVPDIDKIIHTENQNEILKYQAKGKASLVVADGIENMTNVRIFVSNPFTRRYVQIFEGVVRGKSSSINGDGKQISIQAYDYTDWLRRIIVPWAISQSDSTMPSRKIGWAAQGVDLAAISKASEDNDSNFKGIDLTQAYRKNLSKTRANNLFFSEPNSVLRWDNAIERILLMGDISQKLKTAAVMNFNINTNITYASSWDIILQKVTQLLTLEIFQDRVGYISIKPPFWNQDVLKNSVVDSSLISNYSEATNWNNLYTRVVSRGGIDSSFQSSAGIELVEPIAVATFNSNIIYAAKNIVATEESSPSAIIPGAVSSTRVWPYDANFKVNQIYGNVNPELYPKPPHAHSGVDLASVANKTAPLYSICSGQLSASNDSGASGFGQHIIIVGDDGYKITYGHMSSRALVKGSGYQRVEAGEYIGNQGTSGHSTGYHLHLQISDPSGNLIDPASYIGYTLSKGQVINPKTDAISGQVGGQVVAKSSNNVQYDVENDADMKSILVQNEIEKRYGPMVAIQDQPMIKSESLNNGETVSDALAGYANYNLNLINSYIAMANVAFVCPMPWLNPGTNIWIDPAGIDKVFYINGITHSGDAKNGCSTQLELSMGRSSDDFLYNNIPVGGRRDGLDDIFVTSILKPVSIYGTTLQYSAGYKDVKNQLIQMHNNATPFPTDVSQVGIFKQLYGGIKNSAKYMDVIDSAEVPWYSDQSLKNILVMDGEYTATQITNTLKRHYDSAPSVVISRRQRLANILQRAKTIMKQITIVDR